MLACARWATPYNLHPLSFYVLAYLAGIVAQAYEKGFCLLYLLLLAWAIIRTSHHESLFEFCKRALARIGIGCVLFFVCGMARFFYEKTGYDLLFSRSSSDLYICTGRVCDITTYTHPYFKKRITLATDNLLRTTDQAFRHKKTALIYLYVPAHEDCAIDDEITIHKLALKKPKNTFEYIRTMRSTVIACVFASQPAYSIKKAPHISWRGYVFEMRSKTTAALCAHLKKSIQPLYTALFLGNKTDIPITSYATSRFSAWGISHHLARSGLHLIIVVWLWLLCLQRLPISEKSKYILLFFLGSTYYLLSWSSLSFDRACLSFFLYKLCSYRRTPLDPMHAISLIVLAFLFVCPAHILCLDFQLSFGLTYALAWFNHVHAKLNKQQNPKIPAN